MILTHRPCLRSAWRPLRRLMTSAPLLIGIHGWLLSSRVWEPFQKAWAAGEGNADQGGSVAPASIPLWCPDLPGFGDLKRPRDLAPTLPAYGRWLAEQALRRADGRPLVLMGHSLGASVVLHAADHLQQQAPDSLKALVLIAAGGGIYQPRPFQRLRQGGRLVVLMRPALPLPLGPFQAERRAALGLLVNSTCRGSIRAIPELVSRLEVESLWISGSQDRVMEPGYVRHLAGYSPQHALVSLPDCGHLPMQSHPEALASALRGWLQSLARPRSCNSASSA